MHTNEFLAIRLLKFDFSEFTLNKTNSKLKI